MSATETHALPAGTWTVDPVHSSIGFGVEYMAHHEAHHIYQMFQRRVVFGKLPH